MPTIYDKEKTFSKILCPQRERFTADPLSSFWSVRRRKGERKGGFGVLGFSYSEFQFENCNCLQKKFLKAYQTTIQGFQI
jgi:hypothetical protein